MGPIHSRGRMALAALALLGGLGPAMPRPVPLAEWGSVEAVYRPRGTPFKKSRRPGAGGVLPGRFKARK